MKESDAAGGTGSRFWTDWDRGLLVVFGFALAYSLFFSILAVLRYHNYVESSLDSGIFNQAIWLLSRFSEPFSTIRGTNLFGDHFAPILLMLAPIYWLKGSVGALLVFQTVAISLGAVPLYLLARDRVNSRAVAFAIPAAYLLFPSTQYVNLFDFHPEAIGITLLLFAFLAIDRGRPGWTYLMCALAAFCKEDMTLAVLMMGIVVYFVYDKRTGVILTGAAAFYFLIVVLAVIPAFSATGYDYGGRLGFFGESTTEAVWNFFTDPRNTVEVLGTRENLGYMLRLLLPTGFICLLAPIYLIPAFPAFMVNIISDFAPQHTIKFQYTAGIIPFLFIAAVFGFRKLEEWAEGGAETKRLMQALSGLLLVCVLAGGVFFGPTPIAMDWRSKYSRSAHAEAIDEGLKLIPPEASVSAQQGLLAKLSERRKLYMFPEPFHDLLSEEYLSEVEWNEIKTVFPITFPLLLEGEGDPGSVVVPEVEYVAIDASLAQAPLREGTGEYERISEAFSSKGYELIYSKDGVRIYRKSGP